MCILIWLTPEDFFFPMNWLWTHALHWWAPNGDASRGADAAVLLLSHWWTVCAQHSYPASQHGGDLSLSCCSLEQFLLQEQPTVNPADIKKRKRYYQEMSELYRTQNYMVLNFSGYNKESALKKEKGFGMVSTAPDIWQLFHLLSWCLLFVWGPSDM